MESSLFAATLCKTWRYAALLNLNVTKIYVETEVNAQQPSTDQYLGFLLVTQRDSSAMLANASQGR